MIAENRYNFSEEYNASTGLKETVILPLGLNVHPQSIPADGITEANFSYSLESDNAPATIVVKVSGVEYELPVVQDSEHPHLSYVEGSIVSETPGTIPIEVKSQTVNITVLNT